MFGVIRRTEISFSSRIPPTAHNRDTRFVVRLLQEQNMSAIRNISCLLNARDSVCEHMSKRITHAHAQHFIIYVSVPLLDYENVVALNLRPVRPDDDDDDNGPATTPPTVTFFSSFLFPGIFCLFAVFSHIWTVLKEKKKDASSPRLQPKSVCVDSTTRVLYSNTARGFSIVFFSSFYRISPSPRYRSASE